MKMETEKNKNGHGSYTLRGPIVITDKRTVNDYISFDLLPIGQIFETIGGNLYLKISEDNSDPALDALDMDVFDLKKNRLDWLNHKTNCLPIDAEIVLNNNTNLDERVFPIIEPCKKSYVDK